MSENILNIAIENREERDSNNNVNNNIQYIS